MKIFRFTLLAALFFSLVSCAPPPYKEFSNNVDNDQAKFDREYNKPLIKTDNIPPLVLDASASQAQTALKGSVSIHAKMPFAEIAKKILQGSGENNVFNSDINPSTITRIDFTGSRQGALDALAASSGYAYTISGSDVTWSTMVTRTFDVSFMPGAAKYLLGNKDTASGSSSSSNNTSTVPGGSSSAPDIDTGGQYSSVEGNISLWDDLQSTIKGMLSEKGKANVSQATTTVTVTDRPQNIRQIQDYLMNMNQSLSRQVALDVEVIEINLSKSFDYGIDWNLVRSFMSGRYGITLANKSSGQVSASDSAPDTLLLQASSGVWNGTQNFINALAQQGKVGVATQPRVVTLNNQVAEIGINTQTTYLAQVATTTTVNVGSTTSLTPGQVTTGFTLFLLPKVQGDNVYLQISSTIATLVKLTQYTSGSGSSENNITAPTVTEKRFNQRSLVPSGATLVLAGFKQLANEANTSSLFGSNSLGGYGGTQGNVETLVLITPTIIKLKGQ